MRFGVNMTCEHDRFDALYGYNSMWLAALALDRTEGKLQNMTPSLTLEDFQYTGKNSTIIKDAIYTSALEVTFTGASVSAHAHHMNVLKNIMPIHMNTKWSRPYTCMTTESAFFSYYIHTGLHKALPQWGQSSRAAIFPVST